MVSCVLKCGVTKKYNAKMFQKKKEKEGTF